MQKTIKKISLLLAMIMAVTSSGAMLSAATVSSADPSAKSIVTEEAINNAPLNIDGINEFVTRLYSLALDRTPDKQGIDAWASVLTEQRGTGVSVAYGFIFSNEFKNKEVSNEEYVKLMYQMFFGRDADQAGLEGWVKVMDSMDKEAGRLNVFNGFANSKEFFELCKSYGIISGTFVEGKDVDQVARSTFSCRDFIR